MVVTASNDIRKRLEECIGRTRYAGDALAKHQVFFARRGFSEEFRKVAALDSSIQLIGLDEIVRAPAPNVEETLTFMR